MISVKTEIRVRYAETDKMQIAHHARYFEWFECARTELLRQIGYPYRVIEEEGTLLPLIESRCRYIAPARYDDLLEITTILRRLPTSTIKLEYRLRRPADGTLIARGHTVHAFLSSSGRPKRPPKKLVQLIKAKLS